MKLKIADPEIAQLISLEEKAQRTKLNFIASENYAYQEVLEAVGSVLTDIYAEGYLGKRYYAGCEQADAIETLAIDRCKSLFNADHANVQPHSGSHANMAVLFAVLEPGDTLMGMSLAAGGHLTHGHPVSFSGILYKSAPYTVNPMNEHIDYEALEELAHQNKPRLIIAGASSYSRIIDLERFHRIAKEVGAYLLVDCAHTAGLIGTNQYPNPVPYADFVTGTTHKTLRGPRGGFILCKEEHQTMIDRAVFPGTQGGPSINAIAGKAVAFKAAAKKEFTAYIKKALELAKIMARAFEKRGYRIVSGGTDIHLFVIDLTAKELTGRAAEQLLEKADILVSRSAIPFDQQKPMITSGIRLGTLAFTTRGYTEENAHQVVKLIDTLLSNPEDSSVLEEVTRQVKKITDTHETNQRAFHET